MQCWQKLKHKTPAIFYKIAYSPITSNVQSTQYTVLFSIILFAIVPSTIDILKFSDTNCLIIVNDNLPITSFSETYINFYCLLLLQGTVFNKQILNCVFIKEFYAKIFSLLLFSNKVILVFTTDFYNRSS